MWMSELKCIITVVMPNTQAIYYISARNENPINDFLNSLDEVQQGKFARIIQAITDYGLISAIPHIKKLANTPIWEIRILGKNSVRIFYAVPHQNTVLLLHGFRKKSQKTPSKEITTALHRLYDWQKINVCIK
jgi:phage-related protein